MSRPAMREALLVAPDPVLGRELGAARLGKGKACQLYMPPWGEMVCSTQRWIICGDWLIHALRRTIPPPSGCSKITA